MRIQSIILTGVISLLLWEWSGTELRAVNGVLDTVIIVGDQTDFYKWTREKAEWTRVVTQLRTIVERNDRILTRLGTASTSGAASAGRVADVTDATRVALAMEERARALEKGKKEYGVKRNRTATLQPAMQVDAGMKVLGEALSRDPVRYEAYAMQDALRERHGRALENQNKVLQDEFSTQKRLLEKLRSAKTDADLQAIQAALAASSQRLELARQKTQQVAEESRLLSEELGTERQRRGEANREWEEKFVEKLRLRAMTSLHAQKGEGS